MAGETSEDVMSMFLRRSFLIGAALAPLASAPAHAQASGTQVWPARPVMLIIPFPAGGAMDLLGRGVAQDLADKLGQQFVVDNRAGAAGNIGAMAAAKASPDGYTILMAGAASLALNKFMFSNMPYDPETELTPIVILSRLPHIFVVNAKVEAKTLKELVDYAKANPGKLSAGVPGVGTTRTRQLPDVPTVEQAGFPGFEATAWFALAVPTGTPAEIIAKINATANAFIRSAKGKEELSKLDSLPAGGTPEETKAFIAAEVRKWAPIIKAAKIQM
jgi:tripartite-type tricarboxylate transporter receptor subunit TctC